MLRHVRATTLLIWGCCLWGADDPKMNPMIERTVAPAISEASKLLDRITDKLVKDLEKVKTDAMKKNDLNTAMAADAKIKDVKAGKFVAMIVSERAVSQDLLGDDSANPIIGKWGNDGVIRWEFLADGTGKHYWGALTYGFRWEKAVDGYIVHLDGPSPLRPLRIVDANTISIEPGMSTRMPDEKKPKTPGR